MAQSIAEAILDSHFDDISLEIRNKCELISKYFIPHNIQAMSLGGDFPSFYWGSTSWLKLEYCVTVNDDVTTIEDYGDGIIKTWSNRNGYGEGFCKLISDQFPAIYQKQKSDGPDIITLSIKRRI